MFSTVMSPIATEPTIVRGGLTWLDWTTAAGFLAAGLLLGTVARRVVQRALRRAEAPPAAANVIGRVIYAAVVVLGLSYALTRLDVQIGPLLGALGVGGIAVAFALQDILENLIAGVMLQTRRPFVAGHQIVTTGYEGIVEQVNSRSTVLRTFDGRSVHLPNSTVLTNPLENRSVYPLRRVTMRVRVAHGTDLRQARDLLRSALAGMTQLAPSPPPEVFLDGFVDLGVDVVLRFWHEPRTVDESAARDAVVLAVDGALTSAGIAVATAPVASRPSEGP